MRKNAEALVLVLNRNTTNQTALAFVAIVISPGTSCRLIARSRKRRAAARRGSVSSINTAGLANDTPGLIY